MAYVTDPNLGDREAEQRQISRELKQALLALRLAHRQTSALLQKAKDKLLQRRHIQTEPSFVVPPATGPLTLHVIHHHVTESESRSAAPAETHAVASHIIQAVVEPTPGSQSVPPVQTQVPESDRQPELVHAVATYTTRPAPPMTRPSGPVS